MATFQQQAPEVQNVGIGDQRIVNTAESGYGDVVNTFAQGAGIALDKYARDTAESKAQEIVSAAQKGLDESVAQAEDFGSDDPAVMGVHNTARKLNKAISQGTVTREHARLLVSNSVVKAIEEQPWLSRQIRQAASNLLGFDPKSEAAKQYFGMFNTREELMSAKKKDKTPYEKTRDDYISVLGDSAETRELAKTAYMRKLEAERIGEDLALGNAKSEVAYRELSNLDNLEATTNVFGAMKRMSDSGQPFSQALWKQTIDEQAQSSWAAISLALSKSKYPPDSTTMAKFKAEHDNRYNSLYGMVGNYGAEVVGAENLKRISLLNELYVNEALPTYKALTDGLGDRTASSLMDIIASADGSPEKQAALIKLNPGMATLFESFGGDPKDFKKKVFDSMKRLTDPNYTRETMTPADAATLDVIATTAADKAPAEERESVVEMLSSKGFTNKALSVVFKRPRSAATDKEVQTVKNEWNTVKATSTNNILIGLSELAADATKGGVTFKVITDSKTGQPNIVAYQGKHLAGGERQLVRHPIADQIEKINKFLRASNNGWATDLGVKNVAQEARDWVTTLNEAQEFAALSAKRGQ